jgi:P-type conjugative transfer protein TrbJ
MKKNVLMRNFKIMVATSVVSLIPFSQVNATGIPVVDIAHIGIQTGFWTADSAEQAAQTAEQVITSAENVLQTIESVTQTAQQIQMVANWVKNLDRLGASEWVGLINDNVIQSAEITNVMNSVAALQYDAARIRSQMNAIFPQGGDWSTYNFSNLRNARQTWNSTLTDAVNGAMQAQAAINKIAARNNRIQTLLNDSNGADGTVRQIQVGNQLNAALIASVDDMNQSMIATQRMFAIKHQMEIAEREAGQEQYVRFMSSYTNRGAAVTVPSSLPPVR